MNAVVSVQCKLWEPLAVPDCIKGLTKALLHLRMAEFGVLHPNALSIALITAVDRKKVCRHALLPNSSMIVMYNEGIVRMWYTLIVECVDVWLLHVCVLCMHIAALTMFASPSWPHPLLSKPHPLLTNPCPPPPAPFHLQWRLFFLFTYPMWCCVRAMGLKH